jgi:hypothetical protein
VTGKIFEVGEIASTLAALHATQLFARLGRAWKIVCVDRLLIQVFGEVQQHLRHFLVGLQTIRAWTVVLLVTLQLKVHANKLDLQRLSLLALCVYVMSLCDDFVHHFSTAIRAQASATMRSLPTTRTRRNRPSALMEIDGFNPL